MVAGLRGIIGRADELARKRRQPLSTAHLLVALLQKDDQVCQLVGAMGVSEMALLGALPSARDERHNGIELCVERARKLAATQRAEPSGLHLLVALAGEARSAAATGLVHLGARPDQLCDEARALLGVATAVAKGAAPASAAQAPAARPRAAAARGGDRIVRPRPARGFHSAVLAEQTESKLLRRNGPSSAPDSRPAPVEPKAPPPSAAPNRTRSLRTPHRTLTKLADGAPRPQPTAAVNYALDARRFPLLASIGRNLTQLAHEGQIDPVIGRQAEIEMLLDVLARRRGNNPVIVGAPGVGKTAIVEGLALALAQGRTGDKLLADRILIELSASSLLAGTGVRGALSERVQTLKQEVAAAEGRVLLFIDEIHGLLAGGDASDNLGNELKTALARGELPLIGATTDAEYRRIFERDAALSRRFTRIEVGEPRRDDALRILAGLAPRYAAHHGVRYEPAALAAAVDMSMRYLPLRQLPDKAIALVDQAGARARRRELQVVDEACVASVVSELSGVPVERLLMKDEQALLALEAHLTQRVIGQGAATSAIAHALRKGAAGFRGARPLGTFLFLGPTGVGKTEMAKAIAELMFPGTPMTRIDMSELSQSHATARLLGAPPGYLGHEEGGQLTEAVRHRPYQLILLDEIEKAHMEVLLSLLPLLDEGRLTDGHGRTVDFTNTVIVMTSNLGAESSAARARIGFGDSQPSSDRGVQARALATARVALPPELWNRIDEPLYFEPLCEADVAEIARRMLRQVAQVTLDKHGVTLEVEASAIEALVAAGGFDRALGARPMRRTVSRLVEALLARALLAHELAPGEQVVLKGTGDRLEIARKTAVGATAQ
ncbi:MAG TPA: ATP-dependent Clp protease ATP-binding subunit [Polyangiales bacterium]